MTRLNLNRQSYKAVNYDELDVMRNRLEMLIAEETFTNDDWRSVVGEIVSFQYKDGSFNLLDSFQIESDCSVYYCYEPTYICTAFLMKAMLLDADCLTGKEDCILKDAMSVCCERKLMGHGFDWLAGLITAVEYFIAADVKTFLAKYPTLCPEFTEMFEDIKKFFARRVATNKFNGDFGESRENDIRRIDKYFKNDKNVIFVYGTLMKGQVNHDDYLKNSTYIGDGAIENYEMFDLGSFPGIVVGNGTVSGEVYSVSDAELEAINRLEGEGYLYIKTEVNVTMQNNDTVTASAYVYNRSVEGCPKLDGKYGNEEYVWYVSYGSNLLEERLKYYIQGGYCMYNNREYAPCTDTTMPTEMQPVIIPFDMFYSNFDKGSWKHSAVSFLDLSKPGMAYGRAYKIKKAQLAEVHSKEGKSANWYPECVRLADIDGLPAYTFAGYAEKIKEPFYKVSAEYGIVLYKGMKECYPQMQEEEIWQYLKGCGAEL